MVAAPNAVPAAPKAVAGAAAPAGVPNPPDVAPNKLPLWVVGVPKAVGLANALACGCAPNSPVKKIIENEISE